MKLAEFSVKRKVTTAMIMMILVVVGFITLSRLGLDFFPDLDFPTVSVVTVYSGASSQDVETTITEPIEQWVSSVNRVKKVTSQTSEGVSVVMVEFEWGTNLDFGAQDLRDQIGLYRSFLPENATDPLVVKFNFAQFPVIFYGVTGNLPTFELKTLIDDEVAGRLERIDGVASAQVFAMEVREILVDIDKSALAARNLSVDRVVAALQAENLNLPAGNIVERHTDLLVRTLGEFQSVEDIGQTLVGATSQGEPIYLRDIAEVKDTMKERRNIGRIQGGPGVFLFINKRSGANTAVTGADVKRELAAIRATLPSHIQFHIAMDQSKMINQVTRNTSRDALEGGILAIIFIFLFLLNWRPTLIIAVVIPLSVITTFIAFYLAGYTLNMLTLGGLALGIGNLIDNAIVVIENIFRHMQLGKPSDEAAIVGTSEVGMAVTASTLTACIVFFPLVFATGITGKMTQPLALSVAFSQVSSLLIGLTIVPLLGSILFKKMEFHHHTRRVELWTSFDGVKAFYRKYLEKALRKRGLVLAGAIALFVAGLAIIPFLGTEFMPAQDQEMIMMRVKMPVGTSLAETDRVVAQVEQVMREMPEVTVISAQAGSRAEEDPSDAAFGNSTTGPDEGLLWVGLTEKGNRKLSDKEIADRIRARLPRLEGVRFENVDMSSTFLGGSQFPVEIKIFGKDLGELGRIGDEIIGRIEGVEGLRDVTHSLQAGKPEYQITVDRGRASRLGLATGQIASTVQAATLGRIATRYREGNEEIDVRVRFQERFRNNIEEIKSIPIMTPANRLVYLSQVASIERKTGPIMINRENQARRVSVTANISGRDLGGVVADIKKALVGFDRTLPTGYFIEFGGSYEQMKEAFAIIAAAFALAVLLIYMVMASQFESLKHPFIIMFTIPLSLIGVVIGLLATGSSVSLPALIGVVLLAGIAVNNGIVMIDYMNQLKHQGVPVKEALVDGAATRLRPVLLTALTTALGMVPMALSRSSGAEFRAPMAVSVLGGLLATTFLTLFVIPILYSIAEKVSFKETKAPAA